MSRQKHSITVALVLFGFAGSWIAALRGEGLNSSSLIQSPLSEDQKQMETVLNDQQTAWNRGDIDGFMAGYWNDDALTFSSGGEVTRGFTATNERYHAKYATAEAMGKLSFSNLEYHSLSESSAFVLGNWALTRATGNVSGNFTLVMKRMDGQWKIVHDHTSVNG
jgi:beta-aspartyl-peptidase (threonine type)